MLKKQSSMKVGSEGKVPAPNAKAQSFKKLRSLKTGEFTELEGAGGSLVIRKEKDDTDEETLD